MFLDFFFYVQKTAEQDYRFKQRGEVLRIAPRVCVCVCIDKGVVGLEVSVKKECKKTIVVASQ